MSTSLHNLDLGCKVFRVLMAHDKMQGSILATMLLSLKLQARLPQVRLHAAVFCEICTAPNLWGVSFPVLPAFDGRTTVLGINDAQNFDDLAGTAFSLVSCFLWGLL